MSKGESHIIDGDRYLTTKIVTLKGKEYQELKSADIMKPSTKYAEFINGELVLVRDRDTFYALLIKYAMCALSLHGTLIMDYTLMLDEDEFAVKNGELYIFNEQKRSIFNQKVTSTKAKSRAEYQSADTIDEG